MIADTIELRVAVRNLKILEASFEALRNQLNEANPALLPVVSTGYVQRIKDLQCDIGAYLASHPEAVSLLIDPEFAMLPVPETEDAQPVIAAA